MKRFILLFLLATPALADTNITVPRNANATIQFELRDAEGATPGLNLEASAVCATGDVTVIKDGAASANATNCFVDETGGTYSLVLAAAQIDGKVTTVRIVDQTGTKVWVDKVINVYTYGDASAFHPLASVNVASIDTGAIDADSIAADAITGAKIAPGAIAKGDQATGFNDLSAAQVNAEVDASIETYHLDHLLAVDYNPASKPGTSTALFNELIESDGGISRYTANALEQAPSGGGGGAGCADVWDCAVETYGDPGTFGGDVLKIKR
jgi:hypothetical protein